MVINTFSISIILTTERLHFFIYITYHFIRSKQNLQYDLPF
jgi:hypothetical protein